MYYVYFLERSQESKGWKEVHLSCHQKELVFLSYCTCAVIVLIYIYIYSELAFAGRSKSVEDPLGSPFALKPPGLGLDQGQGELNNLVT